MKSAALILALGLAFAPVAHAQPVPEGIVQAPKSAVRAFSMERTEQWNLRSKTGRRYQISIARPKAPAPAGGYPVFYVLDPSTAFATLAETVRNHETVFGPVVVVGVGYESASEVANRAYDLTPRTDVAKLPELHRNLGPHVFGGQDAFLDFIEDELKPEVERSFSIDRHRQALFGHSLGGIFVLHALFTRPNSFDAYIAGSPSIWWNARSILDEVGPFETAQARDGMARHLLIAVGGLEAETTVEDRRYAALFKEDLEQVKAFGLEAAMVGNARALADRLKPLSAKGLDLSYAQFPDETHNSVIPAYLSRGARLTISRWYGDQDPVAH
jgi:predicted alpha/beta superfamily hydrolase